MPNQKLKIKKGFWLAKAITKKNAKSFYFSSLLLNKSQKQSAYSVYAICRISDDSVDNKENQKESLSQIKKKISLAYSAKSLDSPLLKAFRKTVNKYSIPKEYFSQLIEGMKIDLNKTRYFNFSQLYSYCYKVAGVVGLIMLYLFGFKDKAAKKYAVDLGIAMQLTNICRDINEDYRRQRIYLPENELADFGITPDYFEKKIIDQNFIKFMQFQIKRARRYYQKSEAGIKLITNRRCRLTACLMKNIYAAILAEIEKNNYNVFEERAHTSFLDKVLISLSTIFKLKYI